MIGTTGTVEMPRLRGRDLAWLLAYPIYQVLGTARHEGSHALAAWAEGARIDRVMLLPSTVDGRFVWGYTAFSGAQAGWLVWAAPYLVDLLTVALFVPLCRRARRWPHAVWLNLVVIGLLSPLVNSAYQYGLSFVRPTSDVAILLTRVPPPLAHGWFVVTLILYARAGIAALRSAR